MIYIYDRLNNIYVGFEGIISEDLNKRGYNEVISTRGYKYQEQIRGVVNINIEILYMSSEDYKKLKIIFLNSTSDLYIEDDDTGTVYSKYCFKGDTLSLTKNENLEAREYYYKGNISFDKR